MRVLKFGGAALADAAGVQRAVRIVRRHGGDQPTVVVSAHAGVTARLERAAFSREAGGSAWDFLRVRHRTLLSQLNLPTDLLERELRELRSVLESLVPETPSAPRLRDHVLSFGERLSTRIFAAALRKSGMSATPVDAFDLGIKSAEGQLDPPALAAARVRSALREVPGIPVVTGFLALDPEGHLTTLGPNGSDLTAAWFGAALGVEEVHLWKCIPGLMTADPRMVPEATLLPRLDWSMSEALARHGTVALHPSAVQPVQRASTPLRLRDLTDPEGQGTRIGAPRSFTSEEEEPLALAHRERLVLVSLPLSTSTQRDRERELEAHRTAVARDGGDPYLAWIRESSEEGPRAEFLLDESMQLGSGSAAPRDGSTRREGLATIAVVGRGLRGFRSERRQIRGAFELARACGARELRGWHTSPRPERSEELDGDCETRVLLVERARLGETLDAIHRALFSRIEESAGTGRDRSA